MKTKSKTEFRILKVNKDVTVTLRSISMTWEEESCHELETLVVHLLGWWLIS